MRAWKRPVKDLGSQLAPHSMPGADAWLNKLLTLTARRRRLASAVLASGPITAGLLDPKRIRLSLLGRCSVRLGGRRGMPPEHVLGSNPIGVGGDPDRRSGLVCRTGYY